LVGGGPTATGLAPVTGLNWILFRSFSVSAVLTIASLFVDSIFDVFFFVGTTFVTNAALSI